jgi:hypothetical protein
MAKTRVSLLLKLPLDILSDSVDLAIRQLDGFGGSPVLRAILGQASSDGDSFPHRILEIAPCRSAPF